MSKQRIIFAIFIILVIVLGGAVWVAKEKSEKMALEKAEQEEVEKQAVPDADFAKYNKVLARNKITGVKDLEGPYKKVTVSDGQITFSFEVPDQWLTETRNSGEVTMNEEELREFLGTNYDGDIRDGYSCKEVTVIDCLGSDDCSKGVPGTQKLCGKPYSDYADMDWDTLKSMSYDDMRKQLKAQGEFNPGFPNATVTPDDKIWYTDIGWDQVHFYILDEKSDASYLSGVTYLNNTAEIRENYQIFENTFLKEVERDKNGKPVIDKGHTGSFVASIKQNNFVVRIRKEAYVEGEFEGGFKHLIETLTFE